MENEEQLASESNQPQPKSSSMRLVVMGVVLATMAVMALIQNSVDAIGIGGTVAVTASASEDAVEIKVTDTGTGMSEESLHHMFDPFYSGRDAGRGIGFGLSKCWRIVTLHNGRVTGANVPKGGAMFTIRLPMAAQRRLVG